MVLPIVQQVVHGLLPLKDGLTQNFFKLHILTRLAWGLFGSVALTWLLFQKKLLPKPVARIVSKALFLPTFPITAMMRIGNYWTKVDDTLFLGCAPMGFMGHPDNMYKIGVRGVINMCYEYGGPTSYYERLGMKQLYLPTVDHFEPTLESMKAAMDFIQAHKDRGEKVYVHCKAAHGRAASIALCWMMMQDGDKTAEELNAVLKSKRKVRGTLFQQPNIRAFAKTLKVQ
ncbi:protein-tyrosine phosphatase-like protein [Ochromonadaceae sp. CCMP2298]|nr:protein-tyrosine phosphatase-like protein [Ochromonadaceae sp. CCMP2298]